MHAWRLTISPSLGGKAEPVLALSVWPVSCYLRFSGIVHIGDTILEVNGVEVTTPDDLQRQLKGAETVSLKIVPSGLEVAPPINGVRRNEGSHVTDRCGPCLLSRLTSNASSITTRRLTSVSSARKLDCLSRSGISCKLLARRIRTGGRYVCVYFGCEGSYDAW